MDNDKDMGRKFILICLEDILVPFVIEGMLNILKHEVIHYIIKHKVNDGKFNFFIQMA